MPFKANIKDGTFEISGFPLAIWKRLREFAGFGGEATYLWPRWIFLRVLGVCFGAAFCGYIVEGQALLGSHGIASVARQLQEVDSDFGLLGRLLLRPTFLWFNSSDAMLAALGWSGLAAAVALTLNVFPRAATALCWYLLLSLDFPSPVYPLFKPTELLLEMAFLGMFFAPGGARPGLGPSPRPLTVCLLRLLALRVMLEAGLCKFTTAQPFWRELRAMDYIYLSVPFPTRLAYLLHNMPHWWHVAEIGLTVLAELVAPLAALFSRRLRVPAVLVWLVFQAGILFTSNFGWLNLAAMGVGVLFLDDGLLRAKVRPRAAPAPRLPWLRTLANTVLGLQLFLTSVLFLTYLGLPRSALPELLTELNKRVWSMFQSSNEYPLYENIVTRRLQLEIQGSRDGGRSWRAYPFRFAPQNVDRLSGLISPYNPRFDADMTTVVYLPPESNRAFMGLLGQALLRNEPLVTGLFAANPFADAPPTRLAFPVYELTFTDFETQRRTGHYWKKTYLHDYIPEMELLPATK